MARRQATPSLEVEYFHKKVFNLHVSSELPHHKGEQLAQGQDFDVSFIIAVQPDEVRANPCLRRIVFDPKAMFIDLARKTFYITTAHKGGYSSYNFF